MEIGKKYKIVYKDQNYTKLASGKLLSQDDFFLHINDWKDGEIWIGKSTIVTVKEVGDRNENGYT